MDCGEALAVASGVTCGVALGEASGDGVGVCSMGGTDGAIVPPNVIGGISESEKKIESSIFCMTLVSRTAFKGADMVSGTSAGVLIVIDL
jgi:hypothetical protein